LKTNKTGSVKRDRLEMSGVVVSDSKGIFLVKVSEELTVQATISGKMRQNLVKILEGDTVKVELNEYDTAKGRIIFRERKTT
jgi:translation initiation factor IF-1